MSRLWLPLLSVLLCCRCPVMVVIFQQCFLTLHSSLWLHCSSWWSWPPAQHDGGRWGQHPSPMQGQGQVLYPWQDLQTMEVEEEEKQREVYGNFRRFVLWFHCVCLFVFMCCIQPLSPFSVFSCLLVIWPIFQCVQFSLLKQDDCYSG